MAIDYLLTGASGFLGRELVNVLSPVATVRTLGRVGCDVNCDLAREAPLFQDAFKTVVHAAGRAHVVPRSEQEANMFFAVNEIGTRNLLRGLEVSGSIPETFVFVSTVAVYGLETGEEINEDQPLRPVTPYGKSKAAAENLLVEWCAQKGVVLTILRLPLLVGAQAPGNLGQLVRLMKKGLYLGIGSGAARKSMVLASDVAQLIPQVTHRGGVFHLTDGHHPSMHELEAAIATRLGRRRPLRLPDKLVSTMAKLGDLFGATAPINTDKFHKLTRSLTFSDEKIRKLGIWHPQKVVDNLPLQL